MTFHVRSLARCRVCDGRASHIVDHVDGVAIRAIVCESCDSPSSAVERCRICGVDWRHEPHDHDRHEARDKADAMFRCPSCRAPLSAYRPGRCINPDCPLWEGPPS